MKKVYFGHPINTYDTTFETLLINSIKRGFPEWYVENPNQECHDEGYKEFGMTYFFEEVLPEMNAGVFLAFDDGMFSSGVYEEAEFLVKKGLPVYEIDGDGGLTDLVLDESRKLSIEDTRKRVYKKD